MKNIINKIASILLNPFILGFFLMVVTAITIEYTVGGFWVFFAFLGFPIGFLIRKLIDKTKTKWQKK